MILYRPALKRRAWYETKLCETYGCQGLATIPWAKHLVPIPHFPADNDRDHLPW